MEATDPLPPSSVALPTLIDLRLGLRRSLLRPAPGWAFLAGLLLSPYGLPEDPAQALAGVLLAFILVDPVWGALWHHLLIAARRLVATTTAMAPPLPYAQERAPLARLWAWWRHEHTFGGRGTWLALLPTLAFSLVLGRPALVASAVALLAGLLAAALMPVSPGSVRVLAALVAIVMPWYVGLMGLAPASASLWPVVEAGTTPLAASVLTWGLPLVVAWLAWLDDDPSVTAASPVGRLGLIAGHGLLVGCLVLAGKPFVAGLLALVLLWPTLTLRRPGANPAPWHLFALIVIAILG